MVNIPGKTNGRKDNSSSVFIKIDLGNKQLYSKDYVASLKNVIHIREPSSYKKTSQEQGWIEVMSKELKALEENERWELTGLPEGHKEIDSKWVYEVKFRLDVSVEKRKPDW